MYQYLKSIIFAGSDVKAKHLIEPKLLQREIPVDVVDGNKVASCENQADQKFLHKCERQDGQHINTIKPTLEKTNAEVEEKSCEKINDENIFENCSDISQLIENRKELFSTSNIHLEGDQLYNFIFFNIINVK